MKNTLPHFSILYRNGYFEIGQLIDSHALFHSIEVYHNVLIVNDSLQEIAQLINLKINLCVFFCNKNYNYLTFSSEIFGIRLFLSDHFLD